MDNNEQDYEGINNNTEDKTTIEPVINQNEQYNYGTGNKADNQNSFNYQYNPDAESKRIDEKAHNMAIASLILGIISIVLSCCCSGTLTLICGIVGIVLWYNAKDSNGDREGMAQAGMICSIVGIVLSVIIIILVFICGLLGSIAESL